MPDARRIPQIHWSKGPSHVPPGFPNITQDFTPLLWLQIRSRRQLSIAFCPRSLNYTEAQDLLRSSVQRSSHEPPRILCHRAETRGAWEAFFPLFSPRFCEIGSRKVVAFVLEALWTQLCCTGRGFLLFPSDILVGQEFLTLSFSCVSMQAPRGAFISFTETHPAAKYSMLSICDSSTDL